MRYTPPKEKLTELLDEFKKHDYDWIAQGNDFFVKEYTRILIKEILNTRPMDCEYWEDVLTELNAL